MSRDTIKQNLAKRLNITNPNDDTCSGLLDGSIDLAARLLTMTNVGKILKMYAPGQLAWTDGSLRDLLCNEFEIKKIRSDQGISLGQEFNTPNLHLIAGMRVELTTNLKDHLLFQEVGKERIVLIFHHASFLRNQTPAGCIFPKGLVEETLRTLALLFPPDDSTRNWYRRQDPDWQSLDEEVVNCGHVSRNIDEYEHWHDRLVELKKRFDEPRHSSLRQLWNDRRAGIQWATLWVAIGFTVFFGLVQSIEGALQVYAAFNPRSV